MSENPLFPIGQVLFTLSAWREIKLYEANILALLQRHVSGDWSDITPEEGEENRQAIKKGESVFSSYIIATHTIGTFAVNTKVWIITEGDRSKTMILLPEEYDSLYAY